MSKQAFAWALLGVTAICVIAGTVAGPEHRESVL